MSLGQGLHYSLFTNPRAELVHAGDSETLARH